MRFRLKDLLLLTAWLSVYLAALMHVFDSMEDYELTRSRMKIFAATFLCIHPFFMVFQYLLNRERPPAPFLTSLLDLRAGIPIPFLSEVNDGSCGVNDLLAAKTRK